MKPIRVLVNSPRISIGAFLEDTLPASRFVVLKSDPGPAFMDFVHQAEIAVIDAIDERPDAAQLEIDAIKKMHSKIPIIVISKRSTHRDACVVGQGVFYYLVSNQADEKLIRVIKAAADVILKKRSS